MTEMMREDLKTLAEIGIAIWGDPEFSHKTTLETIAAVSLLELNSEKTIERAATALLERAAHEGRLTNTRRNMSRISSPFYRLEFASRFILSALHLGRWSYARVARVLDETPERVQELAWEARVQIISYAAHSGNSVRSYPSGNGSSGPNCPEYVSSRPWTQRFLDEEINSGSDRLFLQNHLMACDSCRETLNRCREMYFAVEALIPHSENLDVVAHDLAQTCKASSRVKNGTRSFMASLKTFFKRPDIAALVLISLGLLYYFWKA